MRVRLVCGPERIASHYSQEDFGLGIESLLEMLRATNQMLTVEEPWKLVKSEEPGRPIGR
jgi:methionyl-tRNA synthetase